MTNEDLRCPECYCGNIHVDCTDPTEYTSTCDYCLYTAPIHVFAQYYRTVLLMEPEHEPPLLDE